MDTVRERNERQRQKLELLKTHTRIYTDKKKQNYCVSIFDEFSTYSNRWEGHVDRLGEGRLSKIAWNCDPVR
jgi:hypothetical protein